MTVGQRAIHMMIAHAGQRRRDGAHASTRADAQDAAAAQLPARRHVEGSLGERDAVPGAVAVAGGNGRKLPAGAHAQQPRRGERFAVGITRFGDVERALRVEGDAGRKR
jgi:hypothetical protein